MNSKRRTPTQADIRKSVDVGPTLAQVSPARYWHDSGFFRNEDEARGAFFLAYQQGKDGMGASVPDWMGLTDDEYSAWMRNGAIPPPKERYGSSR